MLHPSYTDLIRIVNSESGEDTPVVNSRYSIVMATAKRARQIIAGEANVTAKEAQKPLSTAVKELAEGRLRILPDLEEDEKEEQLSLSEDPVEEKAAPGDQAAEEAVKPAEEDAAQKQETGEDSEKA